MTFPDDLLLAREANRAYLEGKTDRLSLSEALRVSVIVLAILGVALIAIPSLLATRVEIPPELQVLLQVLFTAYGAIVLVLAIILLIIWRSRVRLARERRITFGRVTDARSTNNWRNGAWRFDLIISYPGFTDGAEHTIKARVRIPGQERTDNAPLVGRTVAVAQTAADRGVLL